MACFFGSKKTSSLAKLSINNNNNSKNKFKNNIYLNEKNKKLLSLKTLKKQILIGTLIVPNSFLYSHKENKNSDNIAIIQKIIYIIIIYLIKIQQVKLIHYLFVVIVILLVILIQILMIKVNVLIKVY